MGESDAFGIDVALLNIFESQVIPVNPANHHNLSKSFRLNLAIIRVLSLDSYKIYFHKKQNLKK